MVPEDVGLPEDDGRQRLGRLTRRADYQAVACTKRKAVMPGMVVQVRRQNGGDAVAAVAPVRVGFTASRKVGNAVARNRARRRLRALAAEILGQRATGGHDLVLIARQETVTRPFADLRRDLVRALRRLGVLRPETRPEVQP